MSESAIGILTKYGIVDNRNVTLLDVLKEALTSGDYRQIDIAVGYLYISGLGELQDELDDFFSKGGRMRILIGSQTNRETYEQLLMAYHSLEALRKRKASLDKSKSNLEKQSETLEKATNFMEHTKDNEILLTRLVKWLESGSLEIRIYAKEYMHAKAYLFHPSRGSIAGIGLVGSSNFTIHGLSANTELNAPLFSVHFETLKQWFEDLWKKAEEFNPYIMKVINDSWVGQKPGTFPNPYEVFIRGLYELYKDVLESETGFLIRTLGDVLYDFQLDAVKRAIAIVNKYDGVLISDVVGLGKSYIGLAILEHFSLLNLLQGRPNKVAVIAPPELVKYWEELLKAFNIEGRVFSSGLLPRRELSPENYKDMEEYIRNLVGIVLVDESHHYTNPSTKSYRNLQELLMGKKVVLLTATPYRKRYRDIINQIRLFRPEKRHPFPIAPQTWDDLIRAIENGELDPSYVLREIMIRRTRHDILKLYGGKGNCIKIRNKKICFPERKLNVAEYRISDVYQIENVPKDLIDIIAQDSEIYPTDIYTLLLAGISSMKYARFDLYRYVKPQFRDKSPYSELSAAGRALRGIEKILYLKRLESSWYSMYQTLKRDIIKTENFLRFVKHNFIPAGDEFDDILLGVRDGKEPHVLSEEEVIAYIEELKEKKVSEYRPGAFRLAELISDLEYDLKKLKAMEKVLRPLKEEIEIDPRKDPKLMKLASIIDENFKEGRKKILIFSEFEETVQWIYRGLKKLGYTEKYKIEMVSSKTKGISDKIKRFAPIANGISIEKNEEIDILISTDILSEGLNLQDANVVVNYDLHWTPIKLIQRIGRVDRIGTEHDVIFVYNFFPEMALEENLGLLEKVRKRIREFNMALGADGKILEESEEWNPSALEAIYKGDIESLEKASDIFSITTLAEKLVREFSEKHKELFERLKKKYSMRSVAKYEGEDYLAFFVCSDGIISQYFIYRKQNETWVQESMSLEEFLEATELNEDTRPFNAFKDMDIYYSAANKALENFKKLKEIKESSLILGKARRPKSRNVERILNKLYRKLHTSKSEAERAYLSKLLELIKWGYTHHEPFARALKEISPNARTEDIIKACEVLIEKYNIPGWKKRVETRGEPGIEGVNPHIVAGLIFVPKNEDSKR
ncbi:helicase-related protein [Pyrococcus yayanosii]|uniref:DNA/RNA helicase, superfamily II n=1 Tax=Pyrococcus yayanosii (strain CH1 / JCM 16557) TaxID=529709 RepID=F8AJ23_PYRYC|nr:helicase-related protein [Pyrococcus yayanosii]AEH24461.1 DNA/RNA helicase, superfamily II [Pyrococcus yayanosii CH1]